MSAEMCCKDVCAGSAWLRCFVICTQLVPWCSTLSMSFSVKYPPFCRSFLGVNLCPFTMQDS